jgi:S-adenosylmethionine decarboxylase
MTVKQDVVPFTGFEGPEKKLHIDFVPGDNSPSQGFRTLTREEWQQRVLDFAKCTVISVQANDHFDAYLLSESSLFVYPTRVIIKTCGTTTLLKTVEPLLQIAGELNMSVRRVYYSRKNFVFPHAQPSPHKNFDEETELLTKYFPKGAGYIIGPLKGDHYHLFFADFAKQHDNKPVDTPPILEVMMHDLSQKKMKQFFRDETFVSASQTTDQSGISNLLPNSVIDSFQFDPCGYSMNGLLGEAYSTIHITPEHHCSYVSYETNCSPQAFAAETPTPSAFYDWLIEKVILVFKPKRFTITLFANDSEEKLCELRKTSACFDSIIPKLKAKYSVKSKSLYELNGANITLCSFNKRKKNSKTPATPMSPERIITKEEQDKLLKQWLSQQ